ncbi:MAG: hypothetical protein AAB509_01305 [Patescibacteria group bacterium]
MFNPFKKILNTESVKISKNKALETVVSELKNQYGENYDFSRFNISAVLKNDGWRITYETKNPEPTVNGGISSGFVYLVDKTSGKITDLEPTIIYP